MRLPGVAVALLLLASAPLAGAQPAPASTDPNVVRADALFAEAQTLLDAGNLEGACAKFDESLRLNGQAIGTLLNVARCDARLGKVASAVALYTDARDHGREQNLPAYVRVAEEQITKLAPLVPHLAIAFVEPLDAMQIVVDDKATTQSGAVDLPLDPGAHHILVSAPGRVSYDQWVKLAKSERKALSVPALAYPTTIHQARSSRRTIGKLVTGGGVVLMGAGLTLGLVAKSRYDDAINGPCDHSSSTCNADGLSKTDSARSLGNVGTVLGAVGVVGTAVGVVLWLRAPHDRTERGVALAPLVGPGEGGVVALGRF